MTTIDLGALAAPDVVEALDFETIYGQRKAALIALYPVAQQAEIAQTLGLDSEPLAILLQENAYREMVLRQRINDAARAVMLAYAKGTDLDQLAALLGIQRLVVTPADPDNDIALVMEADDELRNRVQLAPESFSVAGPAGAYIATALNAHGQVLDAAAESPSPGVALITVLTRDGAGMADADILEAVSTALNKDDARPMTDYVVVQSAEILEYQVGATLYTFPGPDAAVVVAEARKRLDAYVASCHRIGRAVVISGLDAALHVAGIERVVLTEPVATLQASATQALYCTGITINYGGVRG